MKKNANIRNRKLYSNIRMECEYSNIRISFTSLLIIICLEDRNVFARFDEIQSMTLYDIKETVYTKAIKNYKGK